MKLCRFIGITLNFNIKLIIKFEYKIIKQTKIWKRHTNLQQLSQIEYMYMDRDFSYQANTCVVEHTVLTII